MTWIAVGIGAAVGATGGAIIGSKKGGDDVWKDALMGGALGAIGGAPFGGAGGAAAGLFEGGGAAALEGGGAAAVEGGAGTFAPAGVTSMLPESAVSIPGVGMTPGAAMPGTIPGITGSGAVTELGTTVPNAAAGLQSLESGVVNPSVMTPGIEPPTGAFGTSFDTASGLTPAQAGTPTPSVPSVADKVTPPPQSFLDKYGTKMLFGAGTLGLGALLNQQNKQYGIPSGQGQYSGPLSQFKYSPSTFQPTYATPNVYQARYMAGGGITALAGGGDPMNPIQNPVYPQSQQDHTQFATSTQYPNAMKAAMGADYDTRTDPETGQELPMGMADGGIAALGGYSDGGQLLRGPGDGVSDSIPASIGRRQPARLADGEFVVPARAVSELGNGSTEAGAKQLYGMLDRIQKKRKKGKGLAYQASPKKIMPA